MTVRTFKQQGVVFATPDSNINLKAKIDGQEVFNGSVAAIDQPWGWTDSVIDLFSWEDDLTFTGTKQLEITITGGSLMLRDTVANYQVLPESTSEKMVSSGPDQFVYIYSEKYNGTSETYTDPLINIEIDGISQESRPQDGPMGQWTWRVNSGSTFTATVRVQGWTKNT